MMGGSETLTGLVAGIIYRNDENGYTVFEIESDEGEITCVGHFPALREGETVRLTGRYTEHVSYGRQFKAEAYEVRIPEDRAGIERYLASGAIRGIGKTLAHRIVSRFGEDTMRILEEEPERLAEIKGISIRIAREIAMQVEEQSELREAILFLTEYGIPLSLGMRIHAAYGREMYRVLKENPYRLAEEIDGIGFQTADEIAGKIGIRADADFRIRSAVLYVLQNAAGEGNVYLPEEMLVRRTAELLSLPEEAVTEELSNLTVSRRIVRRMAGDEARVYHRYYYDLESGCASMLLALSKVLEPDEQRIDKEVRMLTKGAKIALEEEQLSAVRTAAKYGLTVITGGPGTGKTTAIHEILRYFDRGDRKIALAAPTGRAARRMTETTGYAASTIHRLL